MMNRKKFMLRLENETLRPASLTILSELKLNYRHNSSWLNNLSKLRQFILNMQFNRMDAIASDRTTSNFKQEIDG